MLHGHFAKTLEEFKALAEARDWKTLCRYIRSREGEYIHIPHGTLHAFAPGAVVIALSVSRRAGRLQLRAGADGRGAGIFRDGGILLRHLCERIGQYKRT